MAGRRRRRSSQPSPSSPAPDAGEQEEVGADLSRVLSAVESLTAQVHSREEKLIATITGLVSTYVV